MEFEKQLIWMVKAIYWLVLTLIIFCIFYKPSVMILRFVFETLRGIN